MRSIALALLLLASGCVNSRASAGVAVTGGVVLVGGLVAAATEPNDGEGDQHTLSGHELAAKALPIIGIALALSGVIGMAIFGQSKKPATQR